MAQQPNQEFDLDATVSRNKNLYSRKLVAISSVAMQALIGRVSRFNVTKSREEALTQEVEASHVTIVDTLTSWMVRGGELHVVSVQHTLLMSYI